MPPPDPFVPADPAAPDPPDMRPPDMRPIMFAGCFGWLHPAVGSGSGTGADGAGPLGVVLCRPMGNDDLCSHREWMALADRLARAGMPALRFDYLSTGDSTDADPDSGRLDAWLDSLRAAIACLREQTGAGRVALCGLRLGSALAFLAARALHGRDTGIAALAMLAPVVSGKAYARELRAAAAASNLASFDPPPPASSELTLNSNGFLWPRAMLREIEAIDLAAPGEPPAPQVLMLHHQRGKQAAALAAALRRGGATVEERDFPGYAALMYAPFRTAVPDAAFDGVVDWLAALPAGPTLPALPLVGLAPALEPPGARETPLRFGPGGLLFGMLCEPAPGAPGIGDGFVALILHTGTGHHIGNGRMSVELARRLARLGIASLRMDQAGIGDSPPVEREPPDGPLYDIRRVADVTAALDALEAHGYRSAMAFGICAGAYLAFHVALRDPRVAAVVPANLRQFIWTEGTSLELAVRQAKRSLRSYMRSMGNPGEWRRLLRGEGDPLGIVRVLARRGAAQAWHRLRETLPPSPGSPPARVRGWMHDLSARGVRIWFAYGSDDSGLVEFVAHLGSRRRHWRAYPGLELVMVPDAEHNLSTIASRELFMRMFEGWAQEAAAGAGAGGHGGRA